MSRTFVCARGDFCLFKGPVIQNCKVAGGRRRLTPPPPTHTLFHAKSSPLHTRAPKYVCDLLVIHLERWLKRAKFSKVARLEINKHSTPDAFPLLLNTPHQKTQVLFLITKSCSEFIAHSLFSYASQPEVSWWAELSAFEPLNLLSIANQPLISVIKATHCWCF